MSTTQLESPVEVSAEPLAAPRVWNAAGPTSEYFPTLTRSDLMVVAVLAIAFLLTGLNRLNHTDLWGHLNYGRWIVEQGQVPTVDPFASQPAVKAFTDPAWLAQVLGYITWHVSGPEGLVLAHALLATLSCGLLVLAVARRGVTGPWLAIAAVAAYAIALPTLGTIRPQLFGIVGLPLVLWACTEMRASRAPLFWLPVLFVLWTNLHGSFATGLVVLGLFAASESFDAWRAGEGWSDICGAERVQRAWLALVLAVVASCVNPLGLQTLPAVASFGQNEALEQITEWRPLQWVSLTSLMLGTSLLLTALVAWRSPRRWEVLEVALLVAFGILACSAMRMIAWWAIVWPWVIAPHAYAAWHAWQGASDDATSADENDLREPAEEATTMNTLIAIACVFTALVLAPPSHALLTGQPRGLAAVTSDDTPLFVANEVVRRGTRGAFFAPIDYADYLIWQTGGAMHPLASSHVHLLDADVWKDQQLLMSASPDWLAIADRRGVKHLVLSKDRNMPLARLLRGHPRVEVLYQDQQSILAEILPPAKPRPKPTDVTGKGTNTKPGARNPEL